MATAEGLPKELQEFVIQSFDSVEELETFLLLHESASRNWTAAEISRQLQSNVVSIERRLKDLIQKKLIIQIPTITSNDKSSFCYTPVNVTLNRLALQLTSFYKTHRIRIIELLFSKSKLKLNSFADAFKIRKDD
jgi:hypothetical protein